MKHSVKITILLVSIFFLAQLTGIAVINNYIDHQKTQETGETQFKNLPLGIDRPDVEQQISFVYLIGAVLIGTALLFVLIKFNLGLLWKLWYFTALIITISIALGAFIPIIYAGLMALILSTIKVWKPNIIIHNLSELLVYGGLAAIFVPVLNIFAGIMLLILISVYDAIAVWKSEHMVEMAEFQTENKMFAGLFVPYSKENNSFLSMKSMSNDSEKEDKDDKKKKVKTAVLGGGDIGFPLLFAGAVLKTTTILQTLLIPVFATLALLGLFIYGKEKQFYPAMPFITIGCLTGYLIITLL